MLYPLSYGGAITSVSDALRGPGGGRGAPVVSGHAARVARGRRPRDAPPARGELPPRRVRDGHGLAGRGGRRRSPHAHPRRAGPRRDAARHGRHEVVRAIRDDPDLAGLPVVFLTGRTTDDPRFAAPGVAVLGKPFDRRSSSGSCERGSGRPRDRGPARRLARRRPADGRAGPRAGPDALPAPELTATKQKEHGDFATNVALALAGRAGRPPREVAAAIVAALPEAPFVERVEIAGPGSSTCSRPRTGSTTWCGGSSPRDRRSAAARRRASACRSSS